MTLLWSPPALGDLEAIRNYHLQQHSVPTAERVVARIVNQATRLVVLPQAGQRVRSPVVVDVRRMPVKPYWIYYRHFLDDVGILRIWHYRKHLLIL
jgi:plasmid stabilization system protein ParE